MRWERSLSFPPPSALPSESCLSADEQFFLTYVVYQFILPSIKITFVCLIAGLFASLEAPPRKSAHAIVVFGLQVIAEGVTLPCSK